ncbi:MAG: outer membrane beta-barrel protein [Caulobacteraceae bacterium]
MKSLIAAAASAATLFAFAAPAFAQAPTVPPISVYGNLGYSYANADAGDFHVHRRPPRRPPRPLYRRRRRTRVRPDTDRVYGVDDKLKNAYAGYAVGFLPIAPNADLFARVGYGHSNARSTANGVEYNYGEDSVNYGGGAQYFFTPHDGVRAEYTRFDYRHDAGTANVWSLAYVRKF